jgi:hypothetical protein
LRELKADYLPKLAFLKFNQERNDEKICVNPFQGMQIPSEWGSSE